MRISWTTWRVTSLAPRPRGQGGDEATAGDGAAPEEPDPFGDDFLVGAIVPDH